jgi:hypothetical protein
MFICVSKLNNINQSINKFLHLRHNVPVSELKHVIQSRKSTLVLFDILEDSLLAEFDQNGRACEEVHGG